MTTQQQQPQCPGKEHEQHGVEPPRQVLERKVKEAEQSLNVEIRLRKKVEDNLSAAEEHLQLMIAAAEDYGFLLMDSQGRITGWNPGACKLFGWSQSEILHQPFSLLFTEEDRREGVPERELERAVRDGAADDDRWHLKKDGSRFWAHGITTALRSGDAPRGFVKIVRDLTDQKRAEETLRQSEQEHRALIEQVQDYAIFRTDTQGRPMTWNRGVMRVLGFEQGEFIGQDITRIFTPEDIQRGVPQEELRLAAEAGAANNDRWMRRKDGTPFYAMGMTTGLRDERGKLIGFTKVMRDQTEQKRQTDELASKTSQLLAAEKQREQFLAVLSHELRNPLAPIRTAADLICEEAKALPVVQKACRILHRQLEVMVHLVNDLLEAARITSGKVRLEKRTLDAREIAEHAVESVRPLITSRQQRLSIALDDRPIPIDADPVRLEQIITNLLTNAAKYTPDGGNIWLTVDTQGHEAIVRVRDNGEGIAPEVLPTLFKLFSQAERSEAHSGGGMGIGLSLVRGLVELHHGTVEAQSPGLGEGSEFAVRLPLSASPLERADTPHPPETAAGPLRILIVDDNADAAKLMAMLLSSKGYRVRTEHGGAAGLEAAERLKPHVVLMDIGMPGMNGHEFARHLRAQPALAGVRLVAVSGYGQESDRQLSIEAGIDDHLVKPVDTKMLLSLLETVRRSTR
jgi:PAS domain S-box-containing protein